MAGPCEHHRTIDYRLREKDRRVTILEQEAKHMQEAIERLTVAVEKMNEGLQDLKVWNVKFMAIFVTLSTLFGFIVSHWERIRGLLG